MMSNFFMNDVSDIPEMDAETMKTGITIGEILNKIDMRNNMSESEFKACIQRENNVMQRENNVMQQYILSHYFKDIDDCEEEMHDYD